MSTVSPTSTYDRMAALEKANRTRQARAELKHKIASGEAFAASVLLDPPAEAETMPVGDLLICQRRWGVMRMRKVLARLAIPETRPVGNLTDRKRRQLARVLGGEDVVDEW